MIVEGRVTGTSGSGWGGWNFGIVAIDLRNGDLNEDEAFSHDQGNISNGWQVLNSILSKTLSQC